MYTYKIFVYIKNIYAIYSITLHPNSGDVRNSAT